MNRPSERISVITPAYNESENIDEFIHRVSAALSEARITDSEIIFILDPCNDGSEEKLVDWNRADSRVRMIRLSRRFGQPAATMAGLDHASGDAVIVLDSDLQDPPEVITEMIELWRVGKPIVLAQRRSRTGEPALKKLTAKVGYSFLNRFSEVPIPQNTGDFRLLDRSVVDQLARFTEVNAFLRGLVALVGFESATVFFDRPPRSRGTTHYNAWVGSLRIAFNGIVGFSTALLSAATVIGFLVAFSALVLALTYIVAQLFNAPFPVGNPTIVASVLGMGGLNMIFLGVLGMYISRIYDEVRHRPRYIVDQYVGLKGPYRG